MRFREFVFPSYAIWMSRISKEFLGRIEIHLGDYTCMIGQFSYSTTEGYVYRCAISSDSNPFNIYSNCIFDESICIKDDSDRLSEWYDNIALKANSVFEAYMKKHYTYQYY